jgi:hypothetical protein
MSVQDLEKAVAKLSPGELSAFSEWFEEFLEAAWDKQIAEDSAAGRSDAAIRKADDDFDAGRCRPL